MALSSQETEEETQTQRRSHVETEAEAGGLGPPAQGRLEPRRWRGRKKPPGARGGSSPGTLASSALQGWGKKLLLSHPGCGHLQQLQQPETAL